MRARHWRRLEIDVSQEHFRESHASRNEVSTRMGYVVCVSDAERWTWDFREENLTEVPQVTYKTTLQMYTCIVPNFINPWVVLPSSDIWNICMCPLVIVYLTVE